MCRLYGFHANERTKVECTLVHAQNALLIQSREDRLGRTHPHGWGIGYYEHGLPHVERRATAAFEDLHFSATAERIYSKTIIAHVRLATVGKPAIVNTHPFSHGPWIMAHNGTVTGFARVAPHLEAEVSPRLLSYRQGSTDSELLFLWLLTKMEKSGIELDSQQVGVGEVARVLRQAIPYIDDLCAKEKADQPAKLNILLTNGKILAATRWNNSLYWLKRVGVHDCEICGIPHIDHDRKKNYRAVVIASEPISSENWQEVPNHNVLTLAEDLQAELEPLHPTALPLLARP